MTQTIGIDIGGTGIKAAIVDVVSGKFVGEKIKVGTQPEQSLETSLAYAANWLSNSIPVVRCPLVSVSLQSLSKKLRSLHPMSMSRGLVSMLGTCSRQHLADVFTSSTMPTQQGSRNTCLAQHGGFKGSFS